MTAIGTVTLHIRAVRLSRRMAQAELAEIAQVDLGHLRRWERGLEFPPAADLLRLSSALGVDCASLETAQRHFVSAATPGEGYTTAVASQLAVFPRARQLPTDRLKVLDLFCGSGGFSYGFEMSGRFAVSAGLDLLPDRIHTFRANHRCASSIVGDIRKVPLDLLAEHSADPDIVIGGPPCQGFSSIRPFRALSEGDPRNNLFEHFALVVAKLRPRWFVLENVVGLLTHGGGRVLPQLYASMEAAGYRLDHRVLNAASFGLPQNRERVVVVGSRDGKLFEWPWPTHTTLHRSMAGRRAALLRPEPLFSQPTAPAVTVMEAIHDLPPVGSGEAAISYRSDVELTAYERRMREGSDRLTLHHATAHSERMLNIIRHSGATRAALPEGLTTSGFSSCYSRLDPDKPSVTITVNFVHPASNRCIHPTQDRALTPREGARLQGFPDRFEFVGTRAQVVKQIGNAVPPLLGQVIADALIRQW